MHEGKKMVTIPRENKGVEVEDKVGTLITHSF
jgi:hypothetical protein